MSCKTGRGDRAQGDVEAAQRVLAESVVLQRDLGDRPGLAFVLERLAIVAATHALPERALRLAGASSALRELLGMPPNPAARSSLFTDIHHKVEGLTSQAVTPAHQQDLAVQARYGVRFIRYWYDERTGKVSFACPKRRPPTRSMRPTVPRTGCWLTRSSRSEEYVSKRRRYAMTSRMTTWLES